ncbi:MAG: cation-translocating P-type ATPase, partial [Methanomicrobiales archaeon]|nr:cation-translocating P-type ATPase [Methanomicrobiales archaeon]
ISPLYLASALVGSSFIWYNAVQGIREMDFTADIPVSLATIAAIAIGQYAAAAVVAVLLLIGGMLEEFVAAHADRALDALSRLLPDQVMVRRDGKDLMVPLDELVIGDSLLIRSGERIAADGEIISGTASVNQSSITGESIPVEKNPGDGVFAGTLNELGVLVIRATRVGSETTLGQIRRLVAEAHEQKAPVERVLDRYAKIYTPVAIVLGIGLWYWSGDILRAITMLIVFCPCVMVLATPTALVAAIGNAALSGSLVKKGATIEALANIDTIVFDKTGTLTTGVLQLVQVVPFESFSETDLVGAAASAEKFSEHPAGRAIVRGATLRNIRAMDPASCEVVPGLGVKARVAGKEVLVGRHKMVASRGTDIPAQIGDRIETYTTQGCSVVIVMIDGRAAGLLVLEDTLRDDALEMISRVRQAGIRTIIVSGDNAGATGSVARKTGILDIHCDMMPDEKVAIVKDLQTKGHKVAFVGDGVNDGPALATADVGIAMGVAGTDVAIETASIALLSDDLSRLPHLLQVSKRTMSTIRQNVVFAVGVLLIAVCLTIPGILTPVTGALLHELSSIPVIANSVRLIGING